MAKEIHKRLIPMRFIGFTCKTYETVQRLSDNLISSIATRLKKTILLLFLVAYHFYFSIIIFWSETLLIRGLFKFISETKPGFLNVI